MEFKKGQKVTVLEKNKTLFIGTVSDVSSEGEVRLESGEVFDRHGRSKSGNLWQCAYIDDYVDGDENKMCD